MSILKQRVRPGLLRSFVGALCCAALACCGGGGGGGRAPILGTGALGDAVPTVTSVTPGNGALAVATNATLIDGRFNEPVEPITGSASFTLTCAAPCSNPTGTVTLDSTATVATYTLTPGTMLAPLTLYTATIAGVKGQSNGMSLIAPYVWTFTTGTSVDTTLPRVTSTTPSTSSPGPTANVPANTLVSVVFSEEMAPASINAASFTVTCGAPCTAPAGTVSYAAGTQTALFTPAATLPLATTFTVTVTTGATDLAGNPLSGNQGPAATPSNYIFSFTTAATAPATSLSVQTQFPLNAATGVCPNAAVSAIITVPSGLRLNPATVTSSTFSLTTAAAPTVPLIAASVSVDAATGQIVTFTPLLALVPGVSYIATLVGGVNGIEDLAVPANTLPASVSWTFTAGVATAACIAPIALNTAAPFGTFGGSAGMTNTGVLTVINGDIGTTAASTTVTGFNDATAGCVYTETPSNIGLVNGSIDTAPPPPTVACRTEGTTATLQIATQARADALVAYTQLAGMPAGSDPGAGSLSNLTLTPGVYTAAGGSFMIQGGNLTLDAGGNVNAVWVFQMASTLTVGGPGTAFPQSIILKNGAQANNVYWQVGTAATINAAGGGTMVGTIIAQSGVSFSTVGNVNVVTLNGRAISLTASVTLVDTVINVP